YFVPNLQFIRVEGERALPMSSGSRKPYLLAEIDSTHPTGRVFRREHEHLWNIARRHYFDVALEPITALPQFVSGWNPPERQTIDEWRWMGRRSLTLLPAREGRSALHLTFDVPDELMPSHPHITIKLNGAIVDQFQAPEAHLSRDYEVVAAPNGALNKLEL